MNQQHLLLDIEGTTCPVTFVSEILFPFAERELSHYVREHERDSSKNRSIQDARREWERDQSPESERLKKQVSERHINEVQGLIQYLKHLISIDRKSTALKDLQGQIWEQGYRKGELKSELFPEAAECLRQWHQQKITLSVYSSGSVHAQKLLYKHSSSGNLEALFNHWFDTHTGSKKSSKSYAIIAKELKSSPKNIWFVSDNGEECNAAREAGMNTLFSLRDSNPDREPRDHQVIQSLHEVSTHLAAEK